MRCQEKLRSKARSNGFTCCMVTRLFGMHLKVTIMFLVFSGFKRKLFAETHSNASVKIVLVIFSNIALFMLLMREKV